MQSFSVYKRQADKRKKDTKWLVAWTDHLGKRRAKTAFTDYEASLELARQLSRDAALAAVGKVDPFEQHRRTPVAKHLADFIAGLNSAKRAARYVMQVEHRIQRVLEGLKVTFLHELDPVAVDGFLADLGKREDHSGVTRNEYVTSVKAFTRWAVTYRRAKEDPLTGLRLLERKAVEPAHPRRALAPSELARLMEACRKRPVIELQMIRRGKDRGQLLAEVSARVLDKARRLGRERRLVYLLAAWTGLRRGEIRQLAWGDVAVDTVPARLKLRARTTKSKRADTLPLHPQLAEELRAWRPKEAQVTDRVFSAVPGMKAFRADLKLAGIADQDEAGRFVDFHSLRVSLSTMLAAHGVSPRATQALMRHTDPRLTAGVYTDERLLPLAAEIQNVPAIRTGVARPTGKVEADVQAIVAGLTPAQRQALLNVLGRAAG